MEFAEIFKQKLEEVKTIPLVPGSTLRISTSKNSGANILLNNCLINTIQNSNGKAFIYRNCTYNLVNMRAFIAKYGGGIDVFNSSESQWDIGIQNLVGDNSIGLFGNDDIWITFGKDKLEDPDFIFLAEPTSGLLELAQRTHPKSTVVFCEIADREDKEKYIDFTTYEHHSFGGAN